MDFGKDTNIHCLQETLFMSTSKHRLKVQGWNKEFNARRNQQVGVIVLTTGKIHFKSTAVKRHTEGYHILVNGSIQPKKMIFVSTYVTKLGDPNTQNKY